MEDVREALRLLWNERYPGTGIQDDGCHVKPDAEPLDER